MLKYKSIEELVAEAEKTGQKISTLVLADQAEQMELSEEEIYSRMEESFDVMCEAVRRGQDKNQRSTSGLTGGEGYKMMHYSQETGGGLSGSFMTMAMSRALAVAGYNASMGRIVATPTAGSCGIMPGCLVSLYEDKKIPKREIIMSMFTAAAFGMVIADRACIAGAQGGCQAECGSASGMVAASMVELSGGTPRQCADACAIAIANQLGLVCDPVAGLVEVPCVKRNVIGAVNAMAAADMALAGIRSTIPADQVFDAMKEIGDQMNSSLRETAEGGLAATAAGRAVSERLRENL